MPYFPPRPYSSSQRASSRISHHDVEIDGLGTAREMDGLDHLEAELLVNFWIGGIATFEVARPVFQIALDRFEAVRAQFQG